MSELAAELRTIIALLESFVHRLEQSERRWDQVPTRELPNRVPTREVPTREVPMHESAEECAICLLGLQGDPDVVPLNCGHRFHHACLSRWLESASTCPVCRSEVVMGHNQPSQMSRSLFEETPTHINYQELFSRSRFGFRP